MSVGPSLGTTPWAGGRRWTRLVRGLRKEGQTVVGLGIGTVGAWGSFGYHLGGLGKPLVDEVSGGPGKGGWECGGECEREGGCLGECGGECEREGGMSGGVWGGCCCFGDLRSCIAAAHVQLQLALQQQPMLPLFRGRATYCYYCSCCLFCSVPQFGRPLYGDVFGTRKEEEGEIFEVQYISRGETCREKEEIRRKGEESSRKEVERGERGGGVGYGGEAPK